jgi:hypothetical protein
MIYYLDYPTITRRDHGYYGTKKGWLGTATRYIEGYVLGDFQINNYILILFFILVNP